MRGSLSRLIFRESVGALPLLECLLASSCTGVHLDLPTSESENLMMDLGFSVFYKLSECLKTREAETD
jgi:hypothetical protein